MNKNYWKYLRWDHAGRIFAGHVLDASSLGTCWAHLRWACAGRIFAGRVLDVSSLGAYWTYLHWAHTGCIFAWRIMDVALLGALWTYLWLAHYGRIFAWRIMDVSCTGRFFAGHLPGQVKTGCIFKTLGQLSYYHSFILIWQKMCKTRRFTYWIWLLIVTKWLLLICNMIMCYFQYFTSFWMCFSIFDIVKVHVCLLECINVYFCMIYLCCVL